MNRNWLMQHISRHLHTFVRRYPCSGGCPCSFCARTDFTDTCISRDILQLFYQETGESRPVTVPSLFSVCGTCIYALVPVPEEEYVIGPVRLTIPTSLKYELAAGKTAKDAGWLKTIHVCELEVLITDILLIYNLHHQEILSGTDILLYNCGDPEIEEKTQKLFSDLAFEQRECGKSHNPYEQELREFSSIEQGNPDLLEKSLAEDYAGEVGPLAKPPLRPAKTGGIVVIPLPCRAAIRGGVAPETAFTLSDSYILKIEDCTSPPAISQLTSSAEFQYAYMVRNIREQKAGTFEKSGNPYVSQCRNYVYTHLNDKLRVRDIADRLGIHANYLSALFLACEKIPLSEFIRREKINFARNLLIYSDFSFSEIASSLGFSSQSHLGKQFKEATQMTLKQYRQRYGKSQITEP